MNKVFASPKRTGHMRSGKEQIEKSPKLKNEHKVQSRSKPALKRLSKSFKENLTARSGHNVSSFSPRSPKLNTEASESSIKVTENYSSSKNPNANLTDVNQYPQDFEHAGYSKNATGEAKAKNFKNLKTKLLAKIKRKESFSKANLKQAEEVNKADNLKTEKKERKENKEKKEKTKEAKNRKKSGQKGQKKTSKKKKTVKTGRSGRNPNLDDKTLCKKKEKILKRLSDLNDRINSFRLDAFVTCKNSWDEVHRAAIRIQSAIRGFLVRKVFSQTLKRLKENRLREIEIERLKQEHIGLVEKKIHRIQLKSLMEMRENDLQEVSEILKNCENVGHIKKNLEEIINRRYIVLSRSMASLPLSNDDLPNPFKIKPEHQDEVKIVEEFKPEPKKIKERKVEVSPKRKKINNSPEVQGESVGRDPEKTPKKQVNAKECEVFHSRELSNEFVCKPVAFPSPNSAHIGILLDPDPDRVLVCKVNENSEKLKLKRVYFELEVYVFELALEDSILELCKEIDNCQLMTQKSKVPIRHFNLFSNSVQHFATDQYSLLTYLNKLLLHNSAEKIQERVSKYWSPFRILFKLDDYLLEKFRHFQYFTEDSSLRGDKLKRIYCTFELDVINEALSLCLNDHMPSPWVYNMDPNINIDSAIKSLRKKLSDWAQIEAGKVPDLGMLSVLGQLNEDILQSAREKNLEKIILNDVEEDEIIWGNLKYHESGLVLCLEDDLLDDLMIETVGLI